VNLEPAEEMEVEIEDANGRPVATVTTLRARPRLVSLPEGSYRVRFSHPRIAVFPMGVLNQYVVTGLPLDSQDAIEVPCSLITSESQPSMRSAPRPYGANRSRILRPAHRSRPMPVRPERLSA
jgi:hypothetical protein